MSWFVVVCGSSVKNSLRYWPKHAFLVKTWVVIPYSNRLEKLTLLGEDFVQIHREFTEILTEMCSFSRNMGLLPLIPIVSKSLPYFVKVSCKSAENSLRYWPKCAVLVKTWGCYRSFRSSRKVNPTSWRFHANPPRIHWDIDRNVQF